MLAEHQIQHIEDDIAELIRDGTIDRDGAIMMVINFEDYWLIHPSELVGPTNSVNIIAEEADVSRIRSKLQGQSN